MNPVAKANAYLDEYMAWAGKGSAARGGPVTCSKGCFWCCKEMVWAERREAVYLLEQIPAQARPALAAKVQAWWDGFFGGGFDTMPAPRDIKGPGVVLRYRAAALWCPLLADGVCTVYAARPASCRLHAAVGPPLRCAVDSERPAQVYMTTDKADEVTLWALNVMTEDEALPRLQFDHLGVWLGHLLLGKTERTENAIEIETH